MHHDRFEKLARNWPSAWVARTQIYKFTGGAISGRFLANLESAAKRDPSVDVPPSMLIGRKRVYDVDEFVAWLRRKYGQDSKE